METKEKSIKLFLANIHIPKAKQNDKEALFDFLKDVNVRSFNKEDAGRIGMNVLWIITKAKGQFETFDKWKVQRADIWTISEEFVTFALYDLDGNAKPFKVKLINPRFAIVC